MGGGHPGNDGDDPRCVRTPYRPTWEGGRDRVAAPPPNRRRAGLDTSAADTERRTHEVVVHVMGWEQRGDRRIYYRSERAGGRVRRVYVGSGPVAELAANLDELRRLERQARARAWRDEQARHEAADALLNG